MESNDHDIRRVLTAYVEWLDRPDAVDEPITLVAADTDHLRARRRSRSLVLVAAAFVMAIGAATVLARQGDGRVRDRSTPSATEPNPTVTTDASSSATPSTAQPATPDIARGAAMTIAGDTLFATGGEQNTNAIASTRRRFVDGRPDQVLADAPHARAGGIALATEHEIVVASGSSSSVDVYVVAEERWRAAPDPPIDIASGRAGQSGYDSVVALRDGRLAVSSPATRSIAVLTLASGEWRVFAVPEQIDRVGALHWLTPRVLAIVRERGAEQSVHRVAVLDTDTARLRLAPDRSMSSGNVLLDADASTTFAVNGGRLVWAYGVSSDRPENPNGHAVAFTLDPSTLIWRSADAPGLHGCEGPSMTTTSPSRLFVLNACSSAVAVFDMASATWSLLPNLTGPIGGGPNDVGVRWADDRLLLWSWTGNLRVVTDPALEE